ncbi:Exocyst complex component SEC6 [Metarhizium anisopliae]|nr:Exocyst complex component SEC6 [Metarhizium anisopliae]
MDDGPVPKLSELLRHPDDLDKIPALKLEFSRKKGAVDGQLRNGLREQLETTQSGMTGLSDGQKTVQLIKEEMMKIDRLCSESQNMIKDFASINLVSQAHRNFVAVETMRRDLETFNDRLTVAEEKSDQRVLALQEALKDHEEMAARFQSITDGAKKARGYKDKFLQAIKLGAEQQLEQSREEFLDDASKLEGIMKWYFNDLNAVRVGMTPLMPKKWKIGKTSCTTSSSA